MFEKITEQEVNGVYVQSAPDKLTGSAEENKRIFDRLPLLIIDKFNALIDSFASTVETEITASDDKIPTSNAVQKAIDEKVVELGAGDMAKGTYDTNDSGVVDDSERLGGHEADYYAVKAEYVNVTLLADSWSDNKYSLEADYPSDTYDVFVYPSKECTLEQYTAFGGAAIASDIEKNILTALGTAPTIDVPVIVKAVKK